MTNKIVKAGPATLDVLRPDLPYAELAENIRGSRSANSERAYNADIEHYQAWCDSKGLCAMPATVDTVNLYFVELERGYAPPSPKQRGPKGDGWKYGSIRRKKSSISRWHRGTHHPDPTQDEQVRTNLQGIRRRIGTKQTAKDALVIEMLRPIARKLADDPSPWGRRDLAVMLVAFFGGFRESEVASIDIGDLTFDDEGVWIQLGVTKTAQEGEEDPVGLHSRKDVLCPCAALRAWIDWLGQTSGPLFVGLSRRGRPGRRMQAGRVAKIVKRCAEMIGLDPKKFAGHSTRRGLVTTAHRQDIPTIDIMGQTRHATEKMVHHYTEKDRTWKRNITKRLR